MAFPSVLCGLPGTMFLQGFWSVEVHCARVGRPTILRLAVTWTEGSQDPRKGVPRSSSGKACLRRHSSVLIVFRGPLLLPLLLALSYLLREGGLNECGHFLLRLIAAADEARKRS